MLAGIRDIQVISTPQDAPRFQQVLADGSQWGLRLRYRLQPSPEGLAQTYLIGQDHIGDSSYALILGDNICSGHQLSDMIRRAAHRPHGATVFVYRVQDPERYGVVEFDAQRHAVSLVEKPDEPRSPYAVIGLYFYDNQVIDFARSIRPSGRGELEIADCKRKYLEPSKLTVERLGRGTPGSTPGPMRPCSRRRSS
jgi:glucose-1-phosphate thymidylyltransferase